MLQWRVDAVHDRQRQVGMDPNEISTHRRVKDFGATLPTGLGGVHCSVGRA